jgi:predicted RNA-binding Zn-ribbon protein involved in translation (DUF1610 family)
VKLTNSYCEGIHKALTHHQSRCPICGLWTIWKNKKSGEISLDCDCIEHGKELL